jgi:uncharacterized protein (TIGR02270 family)
MNNAPLRHVKFVIDQHAEEAGFLWTIRNMAVRAPHYSLKELSHLDSRVEAHLDGLRIAQEYGWETCFNLLQEMGGLGGVFTCASLAFESSIESRISSVLDIAIKEPTLTAAVISALGWIGLDNAKSHIVNLSKSLEPSIRKIAIAASAILRHNPGDALIDSATDNDPQLRARSLKAIGELKRSDAQSILTAALADQNPDCAYWSAWSLTLSGSTKGLTTLRKVSQSKSRYAVQAAEMVARIIPVEESMTWLEKLTESSDTERIAYTVAGAIGDPRAVEWLLDDSNIKNPKFSRICGEAFSMITGADLSYFNLEGDAPEDFDAGPTDDPDDDNVEMDRDEHLPWPHPERIKKWWNEHSEEFCEGDRYLAGEKISNEGCSKILSNGKQRQRYAAARELLIKNPKQPFFEVRAPGFRQQTCLANR